MRVEDLRNYSDVAIKEKLKEFEDCSLFTWEGMDDDTKNLQVIYDHLNLTDENVLYIWSGKQTNKCYGLTGSNKYPNDLTFVGVWNYYNPIVKLQVGARWWDDCCENNREREERSW
jgi:hypothetical protein